ncbi:unnamed protein product [Sphagnum tenellum]
MEIPEVETSKIARALQAEEEEAQLRRQQLTQEDIEGIPDLARHLYVRAFKFRGLKRIRSSVLDRAIEQSGIDYAHTRMEVLVRLEALRQELASLGLFEDITMVVDEAPKDHPDGVDVILSVKERSVRFGTAGASMKKEDGWQSVSGDVDISLISPLGFGEMFSGEFKYAPLLQR